jgi:hypothetical protein
MHDSSFIRKYRFRIEQVGFRAAPEAKLKGMLLTSGSKHHESQGI